MRRFNPGCRVGCHDRDAKRNAALSATGASSRAWDRMAPMRSHGLAAMFGSVSMSMSAYGQCSLDLIHQIEHGTNSECYKLALDGDHALFGSPTENCAFAYRWQEGAWRHIQTLTVDEEGFASDMAVSGELLVVGGPDNDARGQDAGTAYIFQFDGSQWTQVQQIFGSDTNYADYFGNSVAIFGDMILIGADQAEPHGAMTGAIYVFEFDGSVWVEKEILAPLDLPRYAHFGQRMKYDGDHFATYGLGDFSPIWTCRLVDDEWIYEQRINPEAVEWRCDGLSGDRLVIREEDSDHDVFGHVYVFDGSAWRLDQTLESQPNFGHFDLSGDYLLEKHVSPGQGVDSQIILRHHDNGAWPEVASLALPESIALPTAIDGERMLASSWWFSADIGHFIEINCEAPMLRIIGRCPGGMGFVVEGATPGERVAFLYARREGSFEIPPGNPCSGTVLGLNRTVQLADIIRADGDGVAALDTEIPPRACGRVYLQAIDLTNCATTNVVFVP